MGKKILSIVLVILILTGCSQVSAGNMADNTGASASAENIDTSASSAAEESTAAVTESTAGEEIPEETGSDADAQTQGPLFDPDFVVDPARAWTPVCEEHINLWTAPYSTESLAQIPVGAVLQLERWQEQFACVTYQGVQGYVGAQYIQPIDKNFLTKDLKVITPTNRYTYEQMLSDMEKMKALYPKVITILDIGTSELGRRIPVLQIGSLNAKHQILIQGAIHAREHFTAWLAMAMADHMLKNNAHNPDVCYHIIPMSNPDGVVISQTGVLDDVQKEIYKSDRYYGYTSAGSAAYAEQWKANAFGIDLNRNFESGWYDSLQRPVPSSEKYRGEEAHSAIEAMALCSYTTNYDFDVTVSLHSHGSVIYYQYGNRQPVNQLSYSLARAVAKVTGYIPLQNDNTSGAGYKDWVIEELEIPSLTLEIGSNATPIIQQDMYNIFDRCKNLLPVLYQWVSQH